MKLFKLLAVSFAIMIGFGSCTEDCNHDFIEHDHSQELVGTWSIIGPNYAEALIIKEDKTMQWITSDAGEYSETTARYEAVNNRMTIFWEDGTIENGRLSVVPGCDFIMTLDEETGGGYYYAFCYEDLSDKMVGSWLIQTDITSEIHSYYADGTTDCKAYYYHLDEPFETYMEGTYKVVGDMLFDNAVYGDKTYCYASRISHTPNGSPFGDVMTSLSLGMNDEYEAVDHFTKIVRVSPSLDLAGKKYDYKETIVTNVEGEDKDINFMGYTVNFAQMDGSELDKLLRALLFDIEFPDANTINYSYHQNNGKQPLDAPINIEGNKITIAMSQKVPTLKDVVFYAFQSVNGNRLHLCMDKTAFVNFHTNMQAKLMEATNEQFDIANADAVDAIYNTINSAIQAIKVNFVMEKAKK